jgi:hypothetical protein
MSIANTTFGNLYERFTGEAPTAVKVEKRI